MRLTVLGSSGSAPSAGRLCSGYLVQTDEVSVMLDAGNGASANLQRFVDLVDLDAVVVSHRHADHCVDLIGMHHAIRGRGGVAPAIPLHAHPSVTDMLAGLTSREAPYVLGDSFAVHDVGPGDRIEVGDLTITLFPSIHSVPAVSMRLEAGGRVLTYSGDSAGGDDLVAASRGADLLLCEATWQGDAADLPSGLHLTAAGAGEVARAAGVGRLMLTHVAGHLDRDVSRAQAADTWDGEVEVADDLAATDV